VTRRETSVARDGQDYSLEGLLAGFEANEDDGLNEVGTVTVCTCF
jgi:hypothetical protein